MQMMGEGMMGPGMIEMMGQGMGMMATGGPGPAMILRMGEALDLTDEQRTQLQAIQSEYSDSVQPLMAAVMEAHQDAATALEGDSPDFDAYEWALREAADQMVQAHVAMAQAAAEGGGRTDGRTASAAARQHANDARDDGPGTVRDDGHPG